MGWIPHAGIKLVPSSGWLSADGVVANPADDDAHSANTSVLLSGSNPLTQIRLTPAAAASLASSRPRPVGSNSLCVKWQCASTYNERRPSRRWIEWSPVGFSCCINMVEAVGGGSSVVVARGVRCAMREDQRRFAVAAPPCLCLRFRR